jgi:Ca-activated chloride channel family protein
MTNLLTYQFAHPQYLLLLLFVPFMIYWYFFRKKNHFASFYVPNIDAKLLETQTLKTKINHYLPALKILGTTFIILALARPQSNLSDKEINSEGIDIVLSLDISGSMLARDFKPDRLEAAKKISMQFIKERPHDRIGLVVFSGESFTQCPITIDHQILLNLFKNIKSGMVEDGTAIGMGLATAVARLKDSQSKSKVIILMTDGVNNMGYIDPESAIKIAQTYGIRVYTIGIGKNGMAPYPVKDQNGNTFFQNFPVEIDEALLKKIAQQTGGVYYRATDNNKLKSVYSSINRLEKSKIKIANYNMKAERFHLFLCIALFCIVLEFILRNTYLKTIVN